MSNPIDQWLEGLRSELNARRTESSQRVQELSAALALYEQAKSAELVRRYAEEHHLRLPAAPAPSARDAALLLLRCVQALPELLPAPSSSRATDASTPATEAAVRGATTPRAAEAPSPPLLLAGSMPLPRLQRALANGPLVIVGGLNRSEKLLQLPAQLRQQIEWIETTRQGTHAIGNLATRIRQRRLAGVILLEGLLGHKHSDPLISAAREAHVPAAYAEKGSQAAMLRAVLQLERMLPAAEEMPITGNLGASRS